MFIVYIIFQRKVQLIRKFKDRRRGITNYIYRFPKGIKLFFSHNPNSTQTDLSVAIKAGAQYENSMGVPQGTAHFLEHMLYKPNRVHKTQQKIDLFEFGSKSRPNIQLNGFTNFKTITVWGETNYKGQIRLAERIFHIVDYPTQFFSKHIEKERKVVIAETKRNLRPERDKIYQFDKFMIDSQIPNFVRYTIGREEDLKKITADDLTRFYKATFSEGNAIIAVQSKIFPTGKFLKVLEKISNKISRNKTNAPDWPVEKVENSYKVGYFNEPDEEGTHVILGFFRNSPKKIDYTDDLLFNLQQSLIWKVGFDYMREEEGVVYSYETFGDSSMMTDYDINGFHFKIDKSDITRSLNMTYDIFYKKAEKFLLSKQGVKWFGNVLSQYLYPKTYSFNQSYADNKAFAELYGYEIFIPDKERKAAAKVTVSDLVRYLKTHLQKTPIHLFVSSSLSEKEVRKAVHKSKLHKHWSSRVRKKLQK